MRMVTKTITEENELLKKKGWIMTRDMTWKECRSDDFSKIGLPVDIRFVETG